MPEPFSVITGVIGLAATTLHVVRKTKEFLNSVKEAPQAVSSIAKDLELFEGTLQLFETTLTENDSLQRNHHGAHRPNNNQLQPLVSLEPVLQHCREACQAISSTLEPFVTKANDGSRRWRHAATWATSEKVLTDLKRDMLSYKISLDIVISFAGFLFAASSNAQMHGHIRELRRRLYKDLDSINNSSYAGSLANDTEPGFALRRFLLETDTALDSVTDELPRPSASELASVGLSTVDESEKHSEGKSNQSKRLVKSSQSKRIVASNHFNSEGNIATGYNDPKPNRILNAFKSHDNVCNVPVFVIRLWRWETSLSWERRNLRRY
ncbi:hypothetical protein MMC10_010207 [Thelotrema lepadinum]|nr:hypothetical protein [Thelotrema lepadinum]